jgi:hypothetical protein
MEKKNMKQIIVSVFALIGSLLFVGCDNDDSSNPTISIGNSGSYTVIPAYVRCVRDSYVVNNSGEDTHGAGAIRFDTKYEGGPAGEGGERYYNLPGAGAIFLGPDHQEFLAESQDEYGDQHPQNYWLSLCGGSAGSPIFYCASPLF